MISVKEAANRAFEFFIKDLKDLVPEPAEPLVEEVEMDDSRNFWFITISFLAKKDKLSSSPLAGLAALSNDFERKYKTVKVDATTGEIVSMKIRELQH